MPGNGDVPMTAEHLRNLRAEFCRARTRTVVYDDSPSHCHALTRLLRRAIEARNELRTLSGERVRQYELDEFFGMIVEKGLPKYEATSRNKFSRNGILGVQDFKNWLRHAPQFLSGILFSPKDEEHLVASGEKSGAIDQAKAEAARITQFFFHLPATSDVVNEYLDLKNEWVLHPEFAHLDRPATSREAQEELHAMRIRVAHKEPHAGVGLVVRVSARRRLLVVNREIDGLNETGRLTLDLLKEGIHVFHVTVMSPGATARATDSAVRFDEIAKKKLSASAFTRLHTVELDPTTPPQSDGADRKRLVGEYLCQPLRFTLHDCGPSNEKAGWSSWSNLLPSREEKEGPAIWSTNSVEIDDFRTWCSLFIPGFEAIESGIYRSSDLAADNPNRAEH
jgi:hypothetical protein